MKFRFFGAILLLCGASTELLPSDRAKVLYLFGDVSEDGKVPSGSVSPFHQMRLSDAGERGLSQFKEAVESIGVELVEEHDREVALDPEFLSGFRGLILGSNQRRFDKQEADAVRKWVEAGGGLIAWSDSAFGGHFAKVGLDNSLGRDSNNDLTAQFGMYFLTDNGGGNYLVQEFTESHFLNNNQPLGGIRFRGEGVSPIRVTAPARMLAPLQDGGLGGALKVNSVDAPFNPETDAALAVAAIGRGCVVGTFDRNTFWNAGEGTRLEHADNREFARRLVAWAIGLDDAYRPENASEPEAITGIEAWTIRAEVQSSGVTGEPVLLTGQVEGNESVRPTVQWKILGADADSVAFENNNPAAKVNRVTFSQPGRYRIRLEASFGNRTLADEAAITIVSP
ncbi:MAG: hypothetical protein Fur0032_22400 [Terrimicrobiaceae bacterium]